MSKICYSVNVDNDNDDFRINYLYICINFFINNNIYIFQNLSISLTAMYLYFLLRLCLSVLELAIQSEMCVLYPWTQSSKLGPVHSRNTIKGICYILLQ